MSVLERYERQATLLGDRAADIDELARVERRRWNDVQHGIKHSGDPTASRQNFAELFMPVMIADQTAVPGTSEAILWDAPTYTSIPAGAIDSTSKMYRVRVTGVMTTPASTPGTLILTPRWGTTTGGTSLTASATSPTLTVSITNGAFLIDALLTVRSWGASGSVICHGSLTTPALASALNFGGAAVTVSTIAATGFVIGATFSAATSSATTRQLSFESLN